MRWKVLSLKHGPPAEGEVRRERTTPHASRRPPESGREATSTVPSQWTVTHLIDQAVETIVVARERTVVLPNSRDAGSEVVEFGPLSEPDDGSDPLGIGGDRRLPLQRDTLAK